MKLRVAYAKRRYKDTVYQTPLVVTSYRDENGIARNKTIISLASLPDYAVKALEGALKRGDAGSLETVLTESDIQYQETVVAGPAFVVLNTLKQLGIYQSVLSHLPAQQATAILSILTERRAVPR